MARPLCLGPLALVLLAAPGARAEEIRLGPWLQNVSSTSIVIMWETESASAGRVVVQSPIEPDRVVEAPAARVHEVRVDGLTAGRRYTYRVEVETERAGGEFGTAPAGDEPFSFVAFGDSRSNAEAHRIVVDRVRREVPDFLLGTGDMVNEGSSERDWRTFFEIERDLLRENVLFPAVGNHDREGAGRRVDAYRGWFSVPDDAPSPERYYAFSYGNSRFLVLDSNVYSFALSDQTAWLQRELERAVADGAQHIFVTMHHPPYSVSLHGGQTELREMWTPLFERYGVDAVFSGHDHCYLRAEKNGVRYFVTGGAGAPLYPRDSKSTREDRAATVYFERTFNYLRVQVVGDFVEVAAVRDDGTLIESLSWGAMPDLVAAARRSPAPTGGPAAAKPATTAASAAAQGTALPPTPPEPAKVPEAGCAVGGGGGRTGGAAAAVYLGVVLAAVTLGSRRRGGRDLR